jgi:beta-glucosidase
VADLLARMTLEEKIGQMTLVEKFSLTPAVVTEHFIGGVLSGGAGRPAENTPAAWAAMVDDFQAGALATRLGIPILYGVDAVHGHNNLKDATLFPHNIGLGATRDPELLERIGRATAEEVVATGIPWNYAPVVAVARDIRWGRTYESFSEDTAVVTELATAYLRGLQGESLGDPLSMLATPKHFVGDGGTAWGSSTTNDYSLDQGVTEVDEATLRAVHLPPYQAAIEAGAQSIMISFSSWGGRKLHAQAYLINDVLKGELGFEGFTVSDWGGLDQIDGDYYTAVVAGTNAGVDMNMVPYDYARYIATLTLAVERGDVSVARIDDAVSRILRVKFRLGLFEQPLSDPALLPLVGSDEHRALAREAVAKSVVLLKNENAALPLAKATPLLFVAGEGADDIGRQAGGWTIEWQGQAGDITAGTTVLEALQAAVADPAAVHFNRFGRFADVLDAAGQPAIAPVGVLVVSELPYAEGMGDSNDLNLTGADLATLERLKERVEQVVVVIISGRPLIITPIVDQVDAIVAAWLPGSEGQGLADVLFGDVPFTGRLSFSWPRAMDQLPFDFDTLPADGCAAPLYPFGYGLNTAGESEVGLPVCEE